MSTKKKGAHCGTIYGSTTLGERGQVVVPKEAREKLGLKSGDRLLVAEHHGNLILMPEEQIKEMMELITKHLEK